MIESPTGLAILLLEGLGVCVVAAVGYAAWTLTHPPRRTYASAVARGRPGHPGELPRALGEAKLAYESWTFRSRGRDLPVWDIPGGAPGGPAVIFSHGWGDSRIGGLTRLGEFLPLASRVVMWDMPGHGEAPGTCSLGTREVEDLLVLIERVSDPARGVVLVGWSLGAGVSICAAARANEKPAPGRGIPHQKHGAVLGVVAEAPYRLPWTPARNVMRLRGLPWRWNIGAVFAILGVVLRAGVRWGKFDRAEHAARLGCPLLVLHGSEDSVCPVGDGREIAAAAVDGVFVEVQKGQHVGLWTEAPAKDVCGAAVREFLGRVGRDGGARAREGAAEC